MTGPVVRRGVVGLVLASALAGCGGAPGTADSSGRDDGSRTEPTTPRALAAAVLDDLDTRVSAVAPLGRAEGVRGDAVGIELALPREEGDNAHLTVVVVPDGPTVWREGRCRDLEVDRCAVVETDDGAQVLTSWEPGAPEEDPGGVRVTTLRPDGVAVAVSFHGPLVGQERPDDLEVTSADGLEAIAVDPDVAPLTTPALVAAGDDIGEDVWLDWYGQGNGIPSPSS